MTSEIDNVVSYFYYKYKGENCDGVALEIY